MEHEYTLTTSDSGPNVMLVFHMKWIDCFTRSTAILPESIPNFSHVIKQVDQAFSSHRLLSQEGFPYLVFPLAGRYHQRNFSLQGLDGLDKQLARVLDFVDPWVIGLAVLVEHLYIKLVKLSLGGITNAYRWEENDTAVAEYMIYEMSDRAGFIKTCKTVKRSAVLGPLSGQIIGLNGLGIQENDLDIYYRPVLILRQRSGFEKIYRLAIEVVVLKYLEFLTRQAVSEMAHGNKITRTLVITNLKESIPYLLSKLSDVDRVCTLFRLFQICAHLNAGKQGVRLLCLIAEQVTIYPCEENVLRINWPRLMSTLTDFICKLSGKLSFIQMII